MDIATIIGLISGTALLLWAILSKADLGTFIDGGSIAIVCGGSLSAAMISFPIQNLLSVATVVKNCFFSKSRNPVALIHELVHYAEVARRDGILALENVAGDIKDPFLVSGIQMAVDGTDPDLIETVMLSDLEAVEARHMEGKSLFDNIGRYAPAFGMIGTLVGLVIMLQNMSDPDSIGPAMAIALLTTFYGALLANLVALPLADKLGLRSREEMMLRMIVIKGVMAIQSGDNPRIVEQKLKTFLPNRLRVTAEAENQAA
jgi:chemotaxis protein MotA